MDLRNETMRILKNPKTILRLSCRSKQWNWQIWTNRYGETYNVWSTLFYHLIALIGPFTVDNGSMFNPKSIQIVSFFPIWDRPGTVIFPTFLTKHIPAISGPDSGFLQVDFDLRQRQDIHPKVFQWSGPQQKPKGLMLPHFCWTPLIRDSVT